LIKNGVPLKYWPVIKTTSDPDGDVMRTVTDTNGYKSIDYGKLTPVLVAAIKEQQN
jgi:hypothetical protein